MTNPAAVFQEILEVEELKGLIFYMAVHIEMKVKSFHPLERANKKSILIFQDAFVKIFVRKTRNET